jgi:tryptophan synthase alpha chain
VICVDLPPEEGAELRRELETAGIDPILLASPTTTPERLAMLAQQTRGFLYYVSLKGVTGARSDLAKGIEEQVRRIRSVSEIPVCVGFGISTPEQAARVGAFADGVVVGSALVDRISSSRGRQEAVDCAAQFVSELKASLRSPGHPRQGRGERRERGRW